MKDPQAIIFLGKGYLPKPHSFLSSYWILLSTKQPWKSLGTPQHTISYWNKTSGSNKCTILQIKSSFIIIYEMGRGDSNISNSNSELCILQYMCERGLISQLTEALFCRSSRFSEYSYADWSHFPVISVQSKLPRNMNVGLQHFYVVLKDFSSIFKWSENDQCSYISSWVNKMK